MKLPIDHNETVMKKSNFVLRGMSTLQLISHNTRVKPMCLEKGLSHYFVRTLPHHYVFLVLSNSDRKTTPSPSCKDFNCLIFCLFYLSAPSFWEVEQLELRSVVTAWDQPCPGSQNLSVHY